MTQNSDSTPLLKWVDRSMVQYLYAITADSPFNTQIAKVYYQSGEIHSSTSKYASRYADIVNVKQAIAERKEYLEQKVVEHVVRRLDKANGGE